MPDNWLPIIEPAIEPAIDDPIMPIMPMPAAGAACCCMGGAACCCMGGAPGRAGWCIVAGAACRAAVVFWKRLWPGGGAWRGAGAGAAFLLPLLNPLYSGSGMRLVTDVVWTRLQEGSSHDECATNICGLMGRGLKGRGLMDHVAYHQVLR